MGFTDVRVPRSHQLEVPSLEFMEQLKVTVTGHVFGRPTVPMWTIFLHEHVDNDTVKSAILQELDIILANCDLARLGYFARTREGQAIRPLLKESFNRVTMAHPLSIYALFEQDETLICFPEESIQLAKQSVHYYTGNNPAEEEVLLRLSANINYLSHQDFVSVISYDM